MQKVSSQAIQKEHQVDNTLRVGFSFAGKSHWTSSKANPKSLEEREKSLKSTKGRVSSEKENITRVIMCKASGCLVV